MLESLVQAIAEFALFEWIKRRRWLRRVIAAGLLLVMAVLVGAAFGVWT